MPMYDYLCAHCGAFEQQRSIAERDAACPCPSCGAPAQRVLGAAPALATMPGQLRQAHATNERARHAPRSSGEYRALRHPPGCGCCGAKSSRSTLRAPDGSKSFPTKRPWMISH